MVLGKKCLWKKDLAVALPRRSCDGTLLLVVFDACLFLWEWLEGAAEGFSTILCSLVAFAEDLDRRSSGLARGSINPSTHYQIGSTFLSKVRESELKNQGRGFSTLSVPFLGIGYRIIYCDDRPQGPLALALLCLV